MDKQLLKDLISNGESRSELIERRKKLEDIHNMNEINSKIAALNDLTKSLDNSIDSATDNLIELMFKSIIDIQNKIDSLDKSIEELSYMCDKLSNRKCACSNNDKKTETLNITDIDPENISIEKELEDSMVKEMVEGM